MLVINTESICRHTHICLQNINALFIVQFTVEIKWLETSKPHTIQQQRRKKRETNHEKIIRSDNSIFRLHLSVRFFFFCHPHLPE